MGVVIHRQKVPAVDFADVEDPADVRVRHFQRQPNFRQESVEPFGVTLDAAWQELEGDGLGELQIFGAVDLAMPPRPSRPIMR